MDPEKAVWGRGQDTSTAGPADTGKVGMTLHDVTRPAPAVSVGLVPSLEDGEAERSREARGRRSSGVPSRSGPLFRRALFSGGVL